MFNKIFLIILINLINFNIFADNNRIIIASTTSAYDSGLIDYVNREFEKIFNIAAPKILLPLEIDIFVAGIISFKIFKIKIL